MNKNIFGVDIGGTTTKLGLFTPQGEPVDIWEIPTRKDDRGTHILDDVAGSLNRKMTERGLTKDDIAGVGVAAPGAITEDGEIHQAVNIGWSRLNIVEELSGKVKLPVRAANDANAAALGESFKGGGQGFKSMLMVTLGTGIGGGFIYDGKILTGAHGSCCEIGHIRIEEDEEDACGCGGHGCFEQYASATGAVKVAERVIMEVMMEDLKKAKSTALYDKEFTCKELLDASKSGDEVAKRAARKYGYYLGKGLAACATVLDPEAIILGGGVSKAGYTLIDLLKPTFDKMVFKGSRDVKFRLATLGNDAGIYGCAKLFIS